MKKIVCLLISCMMSFRAYAGEREVLQQVYTLITDNYIEQTGLSAIFNPAFKALEKVDNNIKVIQDEHSVTIYYKGKIHKIYSRPKDEGDAKKWADFTVFMLDEVKKISPILADRDFELIDVMLYHGMQAFDKNSHYYPVLEIGQETEKVQGYASSILEGDILYIRLGTINDYTQESFVKTLKETGEVKGIVLDLRGNKGGYLKQALDIADSFMSEGKMIYTLGKEPGKRKFYRASSGEFYKDVPMVVLADGQTASAAEVVALALKENGRAKIVGAQTYGKGTVQNIYKLENGGYLALTTERFFSSRNVPIEGIGVRPSVCSEVFEESSDIEELLAYPYNFMCQKLSRESPFELDVALHILQKSQK